MRRSGMWGMERRSRWSFEYATAIFHFSFYISHFSFPILDSCGSAPSGRHHHPRDWGIAGKAVSAPIVERRLPGPHPTAYMRCRFVKLSDHICPLSFFIYHSKPLLRPHRRSKGFFRPPRRATGERRPQSGQRNNCVIDASSSETPS